MRRLCCHPCWVKNSIATCSNRVHTALNSGWYSARCSIDHIRSECVQRKITCRGEAFLSLKTKSFLHRQSDQIKAYAPTLISVLNLFVIPSNQWPKILATLVGGYKFDAIWMTDHVKRANLHWKKRCLIVCHEYKNNTSYSLASCVVRGCLWLEQLPYEDTTWRF